MSVTFLRPNETEEQRFWRELRERRDRMLKSMVDPKSRYLIFDELSDEEKTKLIATRRILLDLPSIIKSKIDAGEVTIQDVPRGGRALMIFAGWVP